MTENEILILIMIVCIILVGWSSVNDEWNKHKYK